MYFNFYIFDIIIIRFYQKQTPKMLLLFFGPTMYHYSKKHQIQTQIFCHKKNKFFETNMHHYSK